MAVVGLGGSYGQAVVHRVQRWLERAQDEKERVQDDSDLDFLVKTVMTSGTIPHNDGCCLKFNKVN
jgi:hypothetical protein